jgi:hypothetical protein
MKKLLILPLCTLTLLAGCNFLQKEPLTSITPNNFFTNSDDAESSITAVYDALQGGGAYGQDLLTMGEMPSDNCTSTSSDGSVSPLENIAWTPTTSGVSNVFRQAYLIINRANIVIKYVPTITMDTTRRSQIQGEARFMRALGYFNLVRAYGGVPLHLTPSESASATELNLPRATSQQVYDQIVADLSRAAIQLAAPSPANVNRASKSSANALLARVQLTQRNWAAAQAAADKVLATNVTLGPFRSLFPAENKGAESLFEVQFAGTPDGQNLLPDEILPFPITTFSFSKFNLPTDELIAYADTVNDLRWAYAGDVLNNSRLVGRSHVSYLDSRKNQAVSDPQNPANDRGNFPYKWTSNGNTFNSPDNTYVLRYAEVLLNYAEASNEQNGPTADALNRLNQVRLRAGLAALTLGSAQAATKQALRNEIDRQRRLEMAFEGERWFDLLRYARHNQVEGGAHTVSALDIIAQFRKGNRDVNYLLFPIPQDEINTNPQLQQNPGY